MKNLLIFNRRYIDSNGGFSIAMLVFGGVETKMNVESLSFR